MCIKKKKNEFGFVSCFWSERSVVILENFVWFDRVGGRSFGL